MVKKERRQQRRRQLGFIEYVRHHTTTFRINRVGREKEAVLQTSGVDCLNGDSYQATACFSGEMDCCRQELQDSERSVVSSAYWFLLPWKLCLKVVQKTCGYYQRYLAALTYITTTATTVMKAPRHVFHRFIVHAPFSFDSFLPLVSFFTVYEQPFVGGRTDVVNPILPQRSFQATHSGYCSHYSPSGSSSQTVISAASSVLVMSCTAW